MAFAFVPFLRIVKGLKADKLLMASVELEMVLLKSNKGMLFVKGEWSMVNGEWSIVNSFGYGYCLLTIHH